MTHGDLSEARRAGHAVVVGVQGGVIAGASVGDSCAWVCVDEDIADLTESQQRKLLVGSGRAVAGGFVGRMGGGRLLVASDGLWKYAAGERIGVVAGEGDLKDAARRLMDLVRSSRSA